MSDCQQLHLSRLFNSGYVICCYRIIRFPPLSLPPLVLVLAYHSTKPSHPCKRKKKKKPPKSKKLNEGR
jgi:hypothetical protein